MSDPLSFSALAAIAGENDDVVEVHPPPTNVDGSSSGPTASSTAVGTTAAGSSIGVGVVAAGPTPLRQPEKMREPEAKGRGQAKNPLKCPSTAVSDSSKNLKGSSTKGATTDMIVEDFEACIMVG